MMAKPKRGQKHRRAERRHGRSPAPLVLLMVVLVSMLGCAIPWSHGQEIDAEPAFTDTFDLASCGFSPTGMNPYFILLPGYQSVLVGEEEGEVLRVEITVLSDIETIQMEDLGTVRTRVVEEREWADGELQEVSRNFYAICGRTNAVYYFGEDVDIYEDDEVVSHDGAWRAGQNGAKPGIMMPGTFLLGARYYQEVAPEVALDRAEHVALGLAIETPAGLFTDCVQVLETTPLEPDAEGSKFYCLGIGLVVDEELELIACGFDVTSVQN